MTYEHFKKFLFYPLLVIASLLVAKHIDSIHSLLIVFIFAVLVILGNCYSRKTQRTLLIIHETFFGSIIILVSVYFLREQLSFAAFVTSFTLVLGLGIAIYYISGLRK